MTHSLPSASKPLDPVVMMFIAMAIAIGLTWIVPSGVYTRLPDGAAVAGSYHPIPKERSVRALLPQGSSDAKAFPASPIALATALPLGMARTSGLIVMILFLGGMFGVLKASGALEKAIEYVVAVSGGRVGVAVPILMFVISAGGSFLGLISEYLLIIPIILALGKRLGREAMFGFAIVAVAAKIGYIGSATNPVILVIAQPLAGVPVFSGVGLRVCIWLGFLAIGVAFVLRGSRRIPTSRPAAVGAGLSPRQSGIITLLILSVVVVIYGSARWHWREGQFAAFYVVVALGIGVVGRIRPRGIAQSFVDGMKSMMLAAFLVGMAGAVEVVLIDGHILDSIVRSLASSIDGLPRILVAEALMVIEMVLTLLIPSASAKAAVSMPILSPIAHLAGISGQTTVLAFLLGNGLVNMISPTSGMLLAYLATAELTFGAWFKYILPLFLILTGLALGILAVAVAAGY